MIRLKFCTVLTLANLLGLCIYPCSTPAIATLTPRVQDGQIVEGADEVELAEEIDVVEGEVVVAGEAFGMPSRSKLLAAKQFELRQDFKIRISQIKTIAGLDAKQEKKLSIASKGVIEKFSQTWIKQYLNMFGGAFGIQDNSGDKDAEDEPVVKINDASEIDANVTQMLIQEGFGTTGQEAQSPFDSRFWQKVLDKTLRPEQLQAIQTHREQTRLRDHQILVDYAVNLLARKVSLDDRQANQIRRHLESKVKSGKFQFGGMYDNYMLLYYATTIEERELKSLLSEAQHQKWKIAISPYAEFGMMMQGEEIEEVVFDDLAIIVGESVGGVIDVLADFADAIEENLVRPLDLFGPDKSLPTDETTADQIPPSVTKNDSDK